MGTHRRARGAAVLLLLFVLLAACGKGEDVIEVTLDKPESDTAAVTLEDGRAVIDVTSASGIGGLTARAAEWPEEIVVQLRLRGLERLEIAYGNVAIATGVASTGDPGPALMLSVTDEQGRVQTVSPSSYVYYPDIRRVTLSGDESAFAVTLPPHFQQGDYDAFRVQWIDFYR